MIPRGEFRVGLARQPNYRERQLGRTLRRLREQSRMSQEEAAGRLRFSPSKMSRIEQGQARNYHEFLAMLDLYGVLTSDYEPYVRLFDRAQERGWWLPAVYKPLGYIEADAAETYVFQVGFVPGIFQTGAYAREMYRVARHPWTDDEIEKEVRDRLRRQRRLIEEPLLSVHAVIDETVLHRAPCDAEQLVRIADCAALPNVELQVIPLSHPTHSGMHGNFTIVDFPEPEKPGVVYLEPGFGSMHLEKEEDLRGARVHFEHLARIALPSRDSLELVEKVAAEAKSGMP